MIRHRSSLDALPTRDPPPGGKAPALVCEQKLRLRLRFATEARRFLKALNGYLALNGQSPLARMKHRNLASAARRACERALDALESHRTNHRC